MKKHTYDRMAKSLMIGLAIATLMSGQAFADTTETTTATGGQPFVSTAQRDAKTGPGSIRLTTVGESETKPQETLLGGATLTMLQSQTDSQILSAIIETSQGNLIVVDGGLGADGDYLKEQILARGGHVSAWLITHPHGDHVGALYKILQDEAAGISSGIQIDGFYYSFGHPSWYTEHDPSEVTMAHSIIGTFAGLPQEMLHTVYGGMTFYVDDVEIQVMNDRYEMTKNPGNNASIVYKIKAGDSTILFLGDMGEEGGDRLLEDVGAEALQADIVQMAHHGQGGVGENLYQAIAPKICLWPTPQWLWDNQGSRYAIQATKNWVRKLGVEKHYCTKDGDQILR